MELIRLAQVDSTLTHAAALLASGKRAPFAVMADRQTAGRGRRGHGWESPIGNLYLTIVLPPTPDPPALHGAWPLKAGVLLARRLAALTGVRATLKWPNDLLFAGRKLGGLLLESSTTGAVAGDVLIGCGLNLNVTPAIAGPYRAVSLQEITGESYDVFAFANDLVFDFAAAWQTFPLADMPTAFEAHAIGTGQLWVDATTGTLARSHRVERDGTLKLSTLLSAKPIQLSSADHSYSWIHLGDSEAPLVLADIGNSRIKLRVASVATAVTFAASADVPTTATEGELETALTTLLANRRLPVGSPLHTLSVHPDAAGRLAIAAERVGLAPLLVPKRNVLRRGDGYALDDLGIDRLAAIEGFLVSRRTKPQLGIGLVVQAGTATTIDAVRFDGHHLGGLILPGIKTSLVALHQVGALLPDVPLPEAGCHVALGHDTTTALQRGAIHAAVGAIERVARDLGGVDEVVVTGGFAALLADPLDAVIEPDLTLKGLRALVLGGLL